MNRKTFIKTCGCACLSGGALASLFSACSAAHYYAENTESNGLIRVKKSEFYFIKKQETQSRKYVLLKTRRLEYPVCIYKHSETDYTALYLRCTHQGCEVQPNAQFLSCPCHGSEFTNRGAVQNPPAEKNLLQFKVTTDDENIYVQL